MKSKIKKWLQGDAILDVASWLTNTYQALKKTVEIEAPENSAEFFEALPSIYELSQPDVSELKQALPAAFDLLPNDVAYKLEMRYRSYTNRKIQKDPNNKVQPVANKKSWCTPDQAHEILQYLYEKLDTVRNRDGLFIDADSAYAFDKAIIGLQVKNIKAPDALQIELEAVLQHHLHLKGWRELKHTIRSFRHAKSNKLVSIKVDESAKQLLEWVKEENNLSNVSEAIKLLASEKFIKPARIKP
ncbi:hypothetical protein [Rheinheimera hassiensis]|uniref:hypothetical protein n=1 Tax=Rheinheimera hassiensis TaxID=1193627 RepID=UPI001F065B7A|nr:hypothetical protein [Rheinheimera hassiensis]